MKYEEIFDKAHTIATEAALNSWEINKRGIEVSVGIFYTNEFARYLIKKRGYQIKYARVQIPIPAEPQRIYAKKFIEEIGKHGIKGYIEEFAVKYTLLESIINLVRFLFPKNKRLTQYKIVEPKDWFSEHNKHGGYTKQQSDYGVSYVLIICKCGDCILDKK
jgi:hypothetical protein